MGELNIYSIPKNALTQSFVCDVSNFKTGKGIEKFSCKWCNFVVYCIVRLSLKANDE